MPRGPASCLTPQARRHTLEIQLEAFLYLVEVSHLLCLLLDT